MNTVFANITPFQNRKHVILYNQGIGDIITGILETHNLHQKDYDKICMQFNAATNLEICRKIYNFLKANTIYKVEPDSTQTLRSPAAILMLGKNPNVGLDCKSYSLFIGGILAALVRRGKKINWVYRFASYKPFDKLPHHVFVVVNPDSLNEIWCDPVIPKFNLHKPYNYKIDKKPMALIAIAGIGRRTKAERKERKKAVLSKVKNKLKKGLKLFVKLNPATAAARNSFLFLMSLNVFGLASNLVKVQAVKEDQLKKLWEGIGGNYTKLVNAINRGKNKGKHHHQVSGIGVVPAIAAAIASATPIILKVKSLLKSVGVDTDDLEGAAKNVIQKIAAKKLDNFADKQIDEEDNGGGNAEFSSEDSTMETNDETTDDSDSETSSDDMAGVLGWLPYDMKRNHRNKISLSSLIKKSSTF